ncbi:MAG: restriction endonuclease subunit S [Candidatus Absconditabacteria bacterium]
MKIETNFKETEIGKIPEDWDVVKLSDILSYIIDNRGKTPPLVDNGKLLLEVFHISRNSLFPNLSTNKKEKRVDEETYNTWFRNGHPKYMDILFATVGSIPNWCYAGYNPNYCIAQNLISLRVNSDIISPIYLRSYFDSYLFLNQFNANVKHNPQPNIRKTDLFNLKVVVPNNKEEQEKIADFLGTIDDKIELNNAINKKLEETAQALFKSRFIDYEPFKDGEFIDSEIGKIPMGWRVEMISNLFEVKDGTHESPKQSSEGKFLVTSKNIGDNFIDFTNAYYISEYDYNDINKRSKVDTNDILISMIGTIGNLILIKNKNINFAIKNIGLFKSSQRPDLTEYIYMYLKSIYGSSYILNNLSGSTQQYITLKSLRSIPVIIPNDNILKKYVLNVKLFFEIINSNIIQNQKLTEIKSYYLPKLISGKIRLVD